MAGPSAPLPPPPPPLPSTERRGRQTACVALSATGAAVLLGVIVSLAVGPGVAEGDSGAASQTPPPPHVAGLSSSGSSDRWFECPPGMALLPAANSQQHVSFLVLGDWGRQGNANQRRVSDAMADVAACLGPSYVVSTGDNFYPEGLFSPDDDQFQRSFAKVYGAEGGGDPRGRARLAKLPFYAALGNHDVSEGRQGGQRLLGRFSLTPALEASARNGPAAAGGRWQCYNGTWSVPDAGRGAVVAAAGGGGGVRAAAATAAAADGEPALVGAAFGVAPLGASNNATTNTTTRPLLDLIVLDTNAFVGPDDAWPGGGREREAAAAAVRKGLERRLRASRAAWRVVVGHHPVHSLGEHCAGDPSSADCGQMAWLGPLLREHGVAAYLAGHEHDLQLIFETATDEADQIGGKGGEHWPAYVVSGGGSNVRSNEFRTLSDGSGEAPFKPPPDGYSAPFVADQQGFVAAVVNETALALHYYTMGHRLPAHTTVLRRRLQ